MRGPRWLLKAVVNGVGAIVTGLVALIAAGTNFMDADHADHPGHADRLGRRGWCW